MRFKTFTAMATLIAFATPLAAQPMPPVTGATYVKKAGASDLFERQSAQTILSTTRNADIRRFANMMLKAHSDSTMKVKSAAMRSHMRVGAPMLDRDQMHMIAELRATRGMQRDRLYVQQQKMAHDQALMLQSGYAHDGDDRNLRMAAGEITPVVQMHIDMLAKM